MNGLSSRLRAAERRLPRKGKSPTIVVLDETGAVPAGFDPGGFERVVYIVPAEGARRPAAVILSGDGQDDLTLAARIEELERRKRELQG